MLRPARWRILPVLLTSIRREVEDVVHEEQTVDAASCGAVCAGAIAEKHTEHEAAKGFAVFGEARAWDDTNGTVQPIRAAYA
jgi:hypothetical protein